MKNFIFIILLCVSCSIYAQENKFEKVIQQFEQLNAVNKPPEGANLFVGSSSIELWQSVVTDYKDYKVINRGFGGSGLTDLVYFTPRIITNYNPSKIFIYSGENDLGEGASAMGTFQMFEQLFLKIRSINPVVPIVFISIKPSYSRLHQMGIQKETNRIIKKYIKKQKNAEFVDIFKLMLIEGKPDSTLFIKDKLHMNAKGYQIWKKQIEKYLVK